MAILVVRDLTKIIDSGTHRVEILRGIDFEVPAGQFVAIMGASGSGKSTLLGLLAGLDTATSGSVILDGTDITGLGEDQLAVVRGRKIGFVFQSYQLIPTLTAEENVLLPYELLGGTTASGTVRARVARKRRPRRPHGSLSHPALRRRATTRSTGASLHVQAADSHGG